jgi:hypothetical protein
MLATIVLATIVKQSLITVSRTQLAKQRASIVLLLLFALQYRIIVPLIHHALLHNTVPIRSALQFLITALPIKLVLMATIALTLVCVVLTIAPVTLHVLWVNIAHLCNAIQSPISA